MFSVSFLAREKLLRMLIVCICKLVENVFMVLGKYVNFSVKFPDKWTSKCLVPGLFLSIQHYLGSKKNVDGMLYSVPCIIKEIKIFRFIL